MLTLSAATLLFGCGGGGDSLADGGSTADAAVACQDDDGCPADQYCQDASMTCMPGAGHECEMDAECGDGQVCNTAVTDCGATRCRNVCEAATCTEHAECGALFCIEGACAEAPSCTGAVCPMGLVCNDQMMCEAPTTCADDSECTSPRICAAGICQSPVTCADNSACFGGLVCQNGTCDDPCTMDEQCGDATTNTCETSTGLCRQRCFDDSTCGFGFICESLVCLPADCSVDSECGNMQECLGKDMGQGRCTDVTSCMMDSECPDNFTCNNMTCVELPACRGDRDCAPGDYCEDRHCQPTSACMSGMCPAGQDCLDDRCVPGLCRGPTDCPNMGEVCIAGECLAAASPSTVTQIRILTPAGTTRFGGTYGFTAVALDAADAIIPGVVFDWASTDTAVATIDTAGLATAQNLAGSTGIIASVDTGAMSIASSSVALTVQAPTQDFAVTVTDGRSGAPVAGVNVTCNAETTLTDAAGFAGFDATTPKTCTAFSANHDYLTVVGLSGTQAQLKLQALSRNNRATGYTGTVDTTFVTAPVRLSFSGGSFASPLFGFAPANILGGDVFNFEVPVIGSVAFPSGATASAEFQGFPLDLKSTFYARTEAGTRRAWTFAGGAELADLGLTSGALLSNILPLLQTFVHGGSSGLDPLINLPYVVDSADIDGDGNISEVLPDYNAFAPKSLSPTEAQRLRFVIEGSNAALPTGANSVIFISGIILPTVGFVPLGLDGISEPSGAIGRFTTAMAPAYAGLEAGEYAVLAAAVNIVPDELPEVSSARLFIGPSLPQEVDLGAGWLAFPNASFDGGQRALNVPATSGADIWHAQFTGATGGWAVFAPSTSTDLVLPAVPMGMDDRSQAGSIDLEAVDLSSAATLDSLFELGTGALNFDRNTKGFSQQRVR